MSIGSDVDDHTPPDLESRIVDDGACVIYDPDESDAWLWSDLVLEINEFC
ncbi:hypothetical protein [Natronomonas amylolytica]